MERKNELLLEALKASLEGQQVNWVELTAEELSQLVQAAEIHKILPLIFEGIYNCPAVLKTAPQLVASIRARTVRGSMNQIRKTREFVKINESLKLAGITPCVVKGVICRNLYPNPDLRPSNDEDVFVREDQILVCHEIFQSQGMNLVEEVDLQKDCELPYNRPGSPLLLELQRHLFEVNSQAYGDLNRYFDGIHTRTEAIHRGNCGLIEEQMDGTSFYTMNHTDHLLYLILHAFKHFLHGGFGIRQVCDIILFANAFGSDIDWDYILVVLRENRIELFSAALFQIGEKYLTFDPEKACYPEAWRKISVDETDMLEDLLDAGIFGQADLSRKHSSNITLQAVIADKRGEVVKTGKIRSAIHAVFLPASKLSGRFPYLKKYPILLPFAWLQRIWFYKKETAGHHVENNAGQSIQIGNERIELLRKYGIIK